MPIDPELRSKGIGASEIAAVLGLSPYEDAFGIYARKLGLIQRPAPKPYQMRGKYFERGIMLWYSDVTGNPTEWYDQTIQNESRSWQLCSPDAFIVKEDASYRQPPPGTTCQSITVSVNGKTETDNIDRWLRDGGCDSKSINWRHRDDWGDTGTDAVPDYVALQLHWSCSTTDLLFWDVAALLSMDDLRIYRIHRDPDIEAVLLDEGYKFWHNNVLARVSPPIGATETATAYLKQRFPRNVENLRIATPEERDLMVLLKDAGARYDRVEKECTEIENRVKLAIGDADGIVNGGDKVSWKKDKDSIGPDWEAIAREQGTRIALIDAAIKTAIHPEASIAEEWRETVDQMAARMTHVTRVGPRKLLPKWAKK